MIKRMRELVKLSVFLLGKIISSITGNITIGTNRMFSLFYTGYISRRFKSIGKGSVINYKPLQLHGLKFVEIGYKTIIKSGVQLTAWKTTTQTTPLISIGNGCLIRENAPITAINEIIIGDHLLTGTNIVISDNSHGKTDFEDLSLPPTQRTLHSKGGIRIGNNVWIGSHACVLSGVTIGDGAVIGANSVVTSNIEPYSVAVGVPAKVIKRNTK